MSWFSREKDKPQTDPVGSEDERGTSSTSKEDKSSQQVAIAQTSIKRLQAVVKEKEDIIVTLQNAVSEAYQAALQEQAHDQAQLEALHEVFLANVGSTSANLHKALQAIARQDSKPSMGVISTLIKVVARSMDDHLEQLASFHENEIQELKRNLDLYKDQNQTLQTQLTEEKTQHQLHINNIVEEVRKQIPDDKHQRHIEVEKYQNQLKSKDSRIKAMKEDLRLMEMRNLMSAQQQRSVPREENTISASEFAKARAKAAYFQSQVARLTEQLREAKQNSMEAQLADNAHIEVVKHLQEEQTKTNNITHRLAVQLAQYRRKEKKSQPITERSVSPILPDFDEAPPEEGPHIHTSLDRGFGVKGLLPGSVEDILSKKIEDLQTKLKKCRGDLKESEENRKLCEKQMQELKAETHRYRLSMLESKHKLSLEKQKEASSSDCIKIKKLLENLEEVEDENTTLHKIVMVDQEAIINNLKKEVIKLKRFCFELGKEDAECDIHEYDLPPMEDTTIPHKENEINQLKFDRDQALWKLGQLERRMHILFEGGAEDRAKTAITCEYYIPPTTAPHAFAGRKLIIHEPNAISLMRDFTRKNAGLPVGSSTREKNLEGLVEGLLRIIEKKHLEVIDLQETCCDTIKHMERGKQLQQKMDELRGKIWNNDECCQAGIMHHKVIEELKDDVEKLRQSNQNLMHALKETENSYVELQEKFHEATKDKFSPRKRCSFNEEEQHDLSDLDVSQQEILRLQKELGEKSQTISDMKSQLEARDDELDYLHGQLAIQEALENEQDERTTKEQLAKENTNVDQLSLDDLQMANEELSKVCDQYEELLERQAEQLGISFEPLRNT